jgi:hypothetical protein
VIDRTLRDQIADAACRALQPLPEVLAGWEGGSAAFDALDAYSDIDLTFLVTDAVSFDRLYAATEDALQTVSPITASHLFGNGRYYKLKAGGDYLMVDLCFLRAGAPDHFLEVERHGRTRPLFDKEDWLRPRVLDEPALASARDKRFRELQVWFPMSQSFVRKAIFRGHDIEALNSFWAATIKPLAELLRMRYCPARWDFGVRYLYRDLPPAVYAEVRDLVWVRDLNDLEVKLDRAGAWAEALLRELGAPVDRDYR